VRNSSRPGGQFGLCAPITGSFLKEGANVRRLNIFFPVLAIIIAMFAFFVLRIFRAWTYEFSEILGVLALGFLAVFIISLVFDDDEILGLLQKIHYAPSDVDTLDDTVLGPFRKGKKYSTFIAAIINFFYVVIGLYKY
jgi:hypothetical protein